MAIVNPDNEATILSLFVKILFIFRQRGEGEKTETSMCGYLLHAPTGDPARNPGMCLDGESTSNTLAHRPALSPLSHTSHGPGHSLSLKKWREGRKEGRREGRKEKKEKK